MPRNAPTIMVSSTCYDLKQVRKDLSRFIEELGYNPLLSEFDYFPIDPDLDTVENCRRRVEQDADIMVLIIGGRYGYVDPKSDKSITNLEYLTARAKGIPIYTFVDKGILPLLPMWERNPGADFGDTVPNTKVFKFIKQVRGKDSVWTIEFEHAQDIVQALKHQFAHQMLEGLNLRKQIRDNRGGMPANISGSALRLILEKPKGWEYSFFAQVLADEVDKYTDIYQEYKLNLMFSKGEVINHDGIIDWIQLKIKESSRMGSTIADLMNIHLPTALAPVGTPANLEALSFVARRIATVYREALEWSLQIRQVHTEEHLQPVINQLGKALNGLINEVNRYGTQTLAKIDRYRLQPEGAKVEAQIVLSNFLEDDFVDLLAQCLQNRKHAD